MARRIDPDREDDVIDAIAELRTIVRESRGRGRMLVLHIREETEEERSRTYANSAPQFPVEVE